jgi:DNA-binding SARP family transcriptional activator
MRSLRSLPSLSEEASLHLLGAIATNGASGTVPLRGAQSRLLLTYTALHHDRPVPVDELADVVWPEGPGGHWQGALRGVVAKVRAFLALVEDQGIGLLGLGGSYEFSCIDSTAVDVFRAEALEQAARRHLADRDLDAAAGEASEAGDILGRPLLPGVDRRWLEPFRAHLAISGRRAHRTASQALSTLGRHEAAVAAAEAAVDSDPYDEASHRALLATLLAAGNRAAGLRVYERFRRLVEEELGVDPDERTRALYVELLGPTRHDRRSGDSLAVR